MRHEAYDDATVVVLRVQEEAGLDLVSDGEQRRAEGFIHHVLSGMEGFDLERKQGKIIRRNRSGREREVPTVVGSVTLVGLDVHQRQTRAAVLDPGFWVFRRMTSRPTSRNLASANGVLWWWGLIPGGPQTE